MRCPLDGPAVIAVNSGTQHAPSFPTAFVGVGGPPVYAPQEAPLARRELRQRGGEFLFVEVGPEGRREDHLRIGGLPEQEVGKPHFARGSDQQAGDEWPVIEQHRATSDPRATLL